MNKFIEIGMKLYHRYLSDIYVIKIFKNSIKVRTKTQGAINFSINDIGKTIYINKADLKYSFKTPEQYFKFLGQKKNKVDQKQLIKIQEERINENFLYTKNYKTPRRFFLCRNNYLKYSINGYFHQYYTGYKKPGNPNFINTLKNTFDSTSYKELIDAQRMVFNIIKQDLENIIRQSNQRSYLCMCVPRAKAIDEYSRWQLMFIKAVSLVAQKTDGLIDGTGYIVRHKNTRTTHLRNVSQEKNDGEMPYPGITKDTCNIDIDKINGKNIILVDDIYTKNVNVAEDCIQALFDSGVRDIIFYVVGYTRRF